MIVLKDILKSVECKEFQGDYTTEISGLCFDSRQVESGYLYVAQKGVHVDGHDFITASVKKGAVAVVCESLPEDRFENVSYVLVEDSAKALANIASNYFGNPSKGLEVVGITGTNGKTTIATQLFVLANQLGFPAGLLSTVKVMVKDKVYPATHTTPDSVQINHYMRLMVDNGVKYCFMEVSSHGIDQSRIEGIHFSGTVFTNLSHDHLDYHDSFKSYRDVKKRLFDGLDKSAFALTNADDRNGMYMLQNTRADKYTYGFKVPCDFHGRLIENHIDGLHFKINQYEIYARMLGAFNAYNLTAIYGVGRLLGWEDEQLLVGVSNLKGADGRFQYEISSTGIFTIVDYAHTPDAVENVLKTIKDFRGLGRLITVIGCGGDRDKTKRPKMAKIASEYSDYLVLTSDNPRTEDPQSIISDMEEGVQGVTDVISILDRRQAIRLACQMANEKDVVLVAGKGHENYQEIKGVRHHFDDREVLKETLTELKK